MAGQVFLSYAREDSELANSLITALSKEGIPVWMDVRDLEIAVRFDDEIAAAIEACSCVLLVLSEHSARSEYVVTKEWGYALQLDKPVYTLRVGDAPIPEPLRPFNLLQVGEDGISGLLEPLLKGLLRHSFRLEAPVLEGVDESHLRWTKIRGATSYLVAESATPDFRDPQSMHARESQWRGYSIYPASEERFFRVKAVGDRVEDSPWSEVVKVEVAEAHRLYDEVMKRHRPPKD